MSLYELKAKVNYASVPKVACSTLKLFFHEVETGENIHGSGQPLHQMYPCVKFRKTRWRQRRGFWKVAVVRNPVDRIVSCYDDKVQGENSPLKRVEPNTLERLDLKKKPTLAEFIERLPEYQKAHWQILNHSEPLRYFLGKRPKWFDRVYDISELKAFVSEVNARSGTEVALVRANESTYRSDQSEVAEVAETIEARFADDFDLFGAWLSESKRGRATLH